MFSSESLNADSLEEDTFSLCFSEGSHSFSFVFSQNITGRKLRDFNVNYIYFQRLSHISSTHTSHSVAQSAECLPTMRRVLGSSLWYKPGVTAHDCTGKRGFRFMPCLKHSPLDDLYKWRLNTCEQIFLPECTALGRPLTSGSNCTAQDGSHLQPSSSVLTSIVY